MRQRPPRQELIQMRSLAIAAHSVEGAFGFFFEVGREVRLTPDLKKCGLNDNRRNRTAGQIITYSGSFPASVSLEIRQAIPP